MQPTKEQLIEAADRLLNCFENLDRWPKLSVAISKKTWYVAPVDDTTRDAIRHLGNPKMYDYELTTKKFITTRKVYCGTC